MNTVDAIFTKAQDDNTCALLKPYVNVLPVTKMTEEIVKIFRQYPEVKKRVMAKVAIMSD